MLAAGSGGALESGASSPLVGVCVVLWFSVVATASGSVGTPESGGLLPLVGVCVVLFCWKDSVGVCVVIASSAGAERRFLCGAIARHVFF